MKRLLFLFACSLGVLFPAAVAVAGTVGGEVSPLAWAQEVEVCLAESAPSENCTAPAADGSYVLGNLVGPVRIEFVPSYRSGLLTQYYDHKATLAEATTIMVPPGGGVGEIDADLVEGGTIEGTAVAAAGGEPLPEVEVCGVSVGLPLVKSCEETDANGEYELHSLPTGLYRVGFRGEGQSGGYEPSYYQDKPSLEQATPVAVTAGEATVGIDASLAEGAKITGVVTAAADGSPLAGIAVCLFAAGGSGPQRCASSGESGAYTFEGLPGGSYQVGFSLAAGEISGEGAAGEEDGFESQYYDGVGSRVLATTISVLAPGVVGGVDASLFTLPPRLAPAPAPSLSTPVLPAPPIASEPIRKKTGCKKPRRRKKVRGKIRCVRTVRHKSRWHHKHRRAHRHVPRSSAAVPTT